MARYPEEVVITDIVEEAGSGSQTPAGDADFFSSWEKPTIKRPSNPPSRTATPSNASRTASPFLIPGANGSRPKSPLNASGTEDSTSAPTSAPRTVTTSSAIRKAPGIGGARKTNVLGAKKGKLGAKKVVIENDLDFEEAERKAKEEAEKIAELGYNPNDAAEVAAAEAKAKEAAAAEQAKIAAPIAVNPSRVASSGPKKIEKSSAEMERLGMGMGRLGFGQVASSKKPAAKKMAFGQVSRAVAEGKSWVVICRIILQLLTCSKMTAQMQGRSSERRKESHRTNILDEMHSILLNKQRLSRGYKDLKAPQVSHQMPILEDQKTSSLQRSTVTWKQQQRILYANLVLQQGMIWTI
jgi:hypothetical protein